MYKLKDVVELLNVSRMTLIRKIKEGKIKAIKIGKSWRITKEELNRIMETGIN